MMMKKYNGKNKYEAIFARSFRRQERKTMGWCATLAIFIIIFTFCIIFKPNYINLNDDMDVAPPSPLSHVKVATGKSLNLQAAKHDGINVASQPHSKINKAKPVCDLKRPRSDICDANGDIRVIGNSSTIFFITNAPINNMSSWNIRPYARKGDENAMGQVRSLTIKQLMHHSHQEIIQNCTRKYNAPAVVFSTGGYAGNLFHDFTDLLIPLYQTSREFEENVHFLVMDKRPWWMNKHKEVLQRLSKYEIIDLDKENDSVLCFPRMIVGLKANKEFSIDDHIPPYSMKNFTKFLRSVYNLKRAVTVRLSSENWAKGSKPPRLLIISRNRTRRLLNVGEVSTMARGLGFEVVVRELESNVSKVSRFVNEFDVMVGVHGAGLSNMIFLPRSAIVVQVVGLGMEWIARNDFEIPSLDMGLRYLDYKIGANESSLMEQYPIGHEVLRNPSTIRAKGWKAFSEVYLNRQDVKLDVYSFRGTLLKALELLHT